MNKIPIPLHTAGKTNPQKTDEGGAYRVFKLDVAFEPNPEPLHPLVIIIIGAIVAAVVVLAVVLIARKAIARFAIAGKKKSAKPPDGQNADE